MLNTANGVSAVTGWSIFMAIFITITDAKTNMHLWHIDYSNRKDAIIHKELLRTLEMSKALVGLKII